MEKLEKVVERLMRQKPNKWTKVNRENTLRGWSIIQFSTKIGLRDYSLARKIPVIEEEQPVGFWGVEYETVYVPDPKSTSYHLSISRYSHNNGTSASEKIEYKNNDLLAGLFDYIDENIKEPKK